MSVHLSLYRFCEDNFTYRINICRFSDDVFGVYLERNNRELVGTFKLVMGVDFERIRYIKVLLCLLKDKVKAGTV